jgi:hypothetical protein
MKGRDIHASAIWNVDTAVDADDCPGYNNRCPAGRLLSTIDAAGAGNPGS